MSAGHRSNYGSAIALPIISLFSLALFVAWGRCTPSPAESDAVGGAGIGTFGGGSSDDVLVGDSDVGGGEDSPDAPFIDPEAPTSWADITPDSDAILVSIVMHCEEPPAYPNFMSDKATFEQHRAALVTFANMLHTYEVKFDYQSDWNFLRAIIMHDSGADTGGKNVLRWMSEDLKFQIDPHAHETSYSYADVAYLIELNGVTPSGIVGGFIAEPANSSKLEQFWAPIGGDQYVSQSWQATALWGAASGNHVNDDALFASGVWKPQDRAHPTTHDEGAPLPSIGNFGGSWENLDLLLELRGAGKLGGGIHTCTIMTNQRDVVDADWRAAFEAELLARRGDAGIRWVTLNEVLDIWQDQYGGAANVLTVEAAEGLR